MLLYHNFDFDFGDSSRFEEKNCNLSQVEIDEMLCLVGDVRTKVASDNAMPSWANTKK